MLRSWAKARLAEVDQTERMLAADPTQAAKIQFGLLPSSAPVVLVSDTTGHTAACRTVGGKGMPAVSSCSGAL